LVVAVAEVAEELVEVEEVALAEVAAACQGLLVVAVCHDRLVVAVCRDLLEVAVSHDHLVVAGCRGLREVLCLVRPPDRGHRSAVLPHSIVPAAELRARQVRQRDPVWVPEAAHDRQFSPELDPAPVPERDWQAVQVSDPDHQLCLPHVRELALDQGQESDPDHRRCLPLVLALDWLLVLESERESPVGRETRFRASEVVTQDQDYPIKVLEFRIARQIAHRLLKIDVAA
jgi:hypothetical protein